MRCIVILLIGVVIGLFLKDIPEGIVESAQEKGYHLGCVENYQGKEDSFLLCQKKAKNHRRDLEAIFRGLK